MELCKSLSIYSLSPGLWAVNTVVMSYRALSDTNLSFDQVWREWEPHTLLSTAGLLLQPPTVRPPLGPPGTLKGIGNLKLGWDDSQLTHEQYFSRIFSFKLLDMSTFKYKELCITFLNQYFCSAIFSSNNWNVQKQNLCFKKNPIEFFRLFLHS